MRRAASAIVVALALSVAGVACGSAKATPGVAKENFTPAVVLDVAECHTTGTSATETCPPKLDLGAPHGQPDTQVQSVKEGSVMLVRNPSHQDRRLVGTVKNDQVFDTGIMHPGDTTVIKLDTPGKMTITETTSNAHTTLTVKPAPAAKD
jgi:hypothetical protein